MMTSLDASFHSRDHLLDTREKCFCLRRSVANLQPASVASNPSKRSNKSNQCLDNYSYFGDRGSADRSVVVTPVATAFGRASDDCCGNGILPLFVMFNDGTYPK
jgi:hypothetical protein